MAEQVQIQGSPEAAKLRNPLGVVGLSLITFGIYLFFWHYYVNKELAEIGKARNTDLCGDNPALSVIAITIGLFALVPPIITTYMTWIRLQHAERIVGVPEGMDPKLGWPLQGIFYIGQGIFQSNFNKVLQAQAGAAPQIQPGQAAVAPPPAPEAVRQTPPPPGPPQS